MTKKIIGIIGFPVLILAALAGSSLAAGAVVPEDGSLVDVLRPLWEAISGKQWWLTAALGLVASVTLLKKYAPAGKVRDFINTDHGSALLVLVGAFGGALATTLGGGAAMSPQMAVDALQVALTAAGGYALINKLLVQPLLRSEWYANKAPAWLKAVISAATWIFTKPDVVREAEKKGEEAVKNNPAPGIDGPAGPNTDV